MSQDTTEVSTPPNENVDRWRCLIVGCNPKLFGEEAAHDHRSETGHRVALWPVRSEEGHRRAQIRNQTGYYDKYNNARKKKRSSGKKRPTPAPESTQETREEPRGPERCPLHCGYCDWCSENQHVILAQFGDAGSEDVGF